MRAILSSDPAPERLSPRFLMFPAMVDRPLERLLFCSSSFSVAFEVAESYASPAVDLNFCKSPFDVSLMSVVDAARGKPPVPVDGDRSAVSKFCFDLIPAFGC